MASRSGARQADTIKPGGLAVRYVAVGDIIPAARNARTHSAAQVVQLVRSIQEFGWTNPLLVDERGVIIAGHGRLEAAKQLALPEVPTIALTGLSAAQKRALALADNQLALNAGWDEELLRLELSELDSAEFDLSLVGFSDEQLTDILSPGVVGLTDADDVPDLPVNPVTRLGDVWLLGKHRLVCGDSTEAAAVELALAGAKPHLMVTDPPYGVDYDANWRNEAEGVGGFGNPAKARSGFKSSCAIGVVINDSRADWREAWSRFQGDVAYVWHASLHTHKAAESLLAVGLELRASIIWAKSTLQISRGHYHWQHEPCWYAVRKGATGHWSGDRKQTTLWEIDRRRSETGHSTQKPVECMQRPMENNSKPGDAVYDPFLGSGTSLIAAEVAGRVCLSIELHPAYVDVAVTRWQQFTGQLATLEASGHTFDQVAAQRGKAKSRRRDKAAA